MSEQNRQTSESQRGIIRLLRSHGIAPTAQRVKIASAMLARPQHLSAEQVLELTNREGRKVSKATIYNTLGLFTRKGLIRELIVDSSRAFYDSSTHRHHHFYNAQTQTLQDIDDEQIKVILPDSLPAGTELDKVEVVIHVRPKPEQ